MDTLDRLIAQLKAENKRLNVELQQVRLAVAALRGATSNGHRGRSASVKPSRKISVAGRRRIVDAQKSVGMHGDGNKRKEGKQGSGFFVSRSPGATDACAVTIVPSSCPRLNTPPDARRNPPNVTPTTNDGSAPHRGGKADRSAIKPRSKELIAKRPCAHGSP